MKYLVLLLIKIILVSNLYSKDFNEYKFNWYPRIVVEDDIIVFENGVVFSLIVKIPNVSGYNLEDLKNSLESSENSFLLTEIIGEDDKIQFECQIVENLNLVVTADDSST